MLIQSDIKSKSLINLVQREGFTLKTVVDRYTLKQHCDRMEPTILIVDPFENDIISLEYLSTILELYDNLKVIIVTTKEYLSSETVHDIIHSKVCALLSVKDKVSHLKKVILNTIKGGRGQYSQYFRVQNSFNNHYSIKNKFDLTEKEIEIIQHVSTGLTTKEIANKLNRSVHTVTTHRRNILKKMDTRNTSDMLIIAIKERVI